MADTNDGFTAALAAAVEASGEEAPDATASAEADSTKAVAPDDGEAASSDSKDDSAEPVDDAASDGADDDADEDGESEPAAGLDDVKKLFLKGDKDAALKALGLDPKILDVNSAKLRAMRAGLNEAKNLKARADGLMQDAAKKEANAAAILKDGKERYGQLVDLKLALRGGDFTAAHDILIALAPEGVNYRTIAEGMAKAASSMSPSERIYRDKLRKMAEDERKAEEAKAAQRNQESSKSTKAEETKRNVEGATKLLAQTELAGIPGAAEKLVELAAKAWDPIIKGLKVPRAELVKQLEKDPIIGQLLELKRLKAGKQPAAKTPPREQATGKFQRKDRAREPAQRDKQKEEFEAALAEATRMEASERRQRRAR